MEGFLAGANIYMTSATLFLAQVTNTPLTFGQEMTPPAGGTADSEWRIRCHRAGLRYAAATLTIIPDIPIQALAILVGIDKFISECRALTNLIRNGVAPSL